MSEWNRSPDNQNGSLDSLINHLRQQNGGSSSNAPGSSFAAQVGSQTNPYFAPSQQQAYYHQPNVSSAVPAPSNYGQQSHHSSGVLSPASEVPQPQPQQRSNADRTANLLNLLKFSQPPSSSQPSQSSIVNLPQTPSQLPNLASSPGGRAPDLLATLMGSSGSKENKQPVSNLPAAFQNAAAGSSTTATSPPSDSQQYLLQLLNRPKPAQIDAEPLLEPQHSFTTSTNTNLTPEVSDLSKTFEDTSHGASSSFEFVSREPASKPSQGAFTYVNPFEQLAASSPRNRTPKSSTAAQSSSSAPAMQILKPPRHAAIENSDHKRKVDESISTSSPAHSKRKLGSNSSTPSPLPDGRTQIEALMGIGASKNARGKGKETVAEALSNIGDQADKEAEHAIARAEEDENRARAKDSQAAIQRDMQDLFNAKSGPEFELSAQVAALRIQNELEKEGNEHVLEDSLPGPMAEAVKRMIDDTAEGHVAESWESADAEDSPGKDDERQVVVKVYNFPMKPWVSITLHPGKDSTLPEFRPDGLMDIARLKKEFDQIDRTLVTSSNNFIVYGMSKNGGIRVIRQLDGKDTKLFTETRDRIFNISLSTSLTESTEAIIGTGISGTVYWATICEPTGEVHIGRPDPEQFGFALPPFKASGEESSGGVVKTRARKSSGHPEFFAVGRGKSIHIIWPSIITKQGYLRDGPERVVDTEKYLGHRSLKINTGKAGKDFTFSQDDTTIVSLDKAGRVKFWDVRTLTNIDRGSETKYPTPEQIQPVEITEPLMTLITTPANEKSWPTSVLFVDKLRPYQKGGALRYLIIGMKQNHTLQLWDLALGKPVQELHLPHEKESDAVCSVVYHASTGMITVGHPTRNSIYFIHLSSPKYNLAKTMSQAEFVQRIVAGDSTLPKPEATAVMSGIREFSFSNKGSLRSLDILPSPSSSSSDLDDPSLFELYAMHSKGVTCMTVRQEDLGWNGDNKVMYPVNAEADGLISVDALKPIQNVDFESPSASGGARNAGSRSTPKDGPTKESGRKILAANGQADNVRAPEALGSATVASRIAVKLESPQAQALTGGQESASGADKVEKKKKKKATSLSRGNAESHPATASTAIDSNMQAPPMVPSPPPTGESIDPGQEKPAAHVGSSSEPAVISAPPGLSQESLDALVKSMEIGISTEISTLFTSSLDTLYRRFDDDKRTQAAVADAKQDAMLRLISSTLSDNVEKTLGNIVTANIKKSVLPAISEVAMKAVNDQMGTKLGAHLRSTLPKELQSVLPEVIGKTLRLPEVMKLMSESLAKTVAFRVEEQFASLLKNSITPAFTALALQAVQQTGNDIQRQAADIIGRLEHERRADSVKIDQLSMLVTGLSETVSTMATAQSKFQGEFLKLQQAAHTRLNEQEISPRGHAQMSRQSSRAQPPAQQAQQVHQTQQAQANLTEDAARIIERIEAAVNIGDIEGAIMLWIQSQQEQAVFEHYFSKYTSSMIRGLNPLMLLSIGACVAAHFEGNLLFVRLDWVDMVFQSFQASANALVSVKCPENLITH
jgi:hypothetical protein